MANASVEVVELLQSTNDHEPHAWIEVKMGGNTLTIRLDGDAPLYDGSTGFKVYLAAGRVGTDENEVGQSLEIPYYQGH
jgi:hypothetical protein